MNTASAHLDTVNRLAAAEFAQRRLATDHSAVTRTVRRHRMVRGGATAIAALGLAGGATFAAQALDLDRGAAHPGASASLTASPVPTRADIVVHPGTSTESAVFAFAAGWAISVDEAEIAFFQARESLLPELVAGDMPSPWGGWRPQSFVGSLDGWIATGTWNTDDFESPEQMAQAMVRATIRELQNNGVEEERWREVLTMASLVELETPLVTDMPHVAAVINNRLENGMHLELASALRFASSPYTSDSAYNTHLHPGLPPGPISTVSSWAIAAVANPSQSKDLYFVTVDPNTGETLFAETLEQHLENLKRRQQ